MSVDLLSQAQTLIQNGDKENARKLIRRMILQEPRNEKAWFMMAQVVEKREHTLDCLEQILKINPQNRAAQAAIKVLKREKAPIERASFNLRAASSANQPVNAALPRTISTLKPAPALPTPMERGVTQAQAIKIERLADVGTRYHRRVKPNVPLILGFLLVSFVILLAIAGPKVAPGDPLKENIILKVGDKWVTPPFGAFAVPGFALGSDQFGRDLLSRVLWAIRPTLVMVSIVAVIRLMIGTIIGLGAGYSTGRIGYWLDLMISAALAVPVLMVALGAIAMLGAELGLIAFIVGLSINGWGESARMIREQTRATRGQLYIEAAHALGASQLRVIFRNILRQIMPMVWIMSAFEISSTLLVTAGLGFLGYYIGGDVWIEVGDFLSRRVSGMPELGQMLATSWSRLTDPWPMVLTGSVIFIMVLGFNLLGQGLRVRLDPERINRNSWFTRLSRRASWWIEENVSYPAGTWLHTHLLQAGAGVLLLVLLVFGGVRIAQRLTSERVLRPKLEIPGSHTWAAGRVDPYGTRWSAQVGPDEPRIYWKFVEPAGFSGSPVVAADGTIVIATNNDFVLALNPNKNLLWKTALPAHPKGPLAIGPDQTIYIGDESGGLSAVSLSGELLWHFAGQNKGRPFNGPVVAEDGVIYMLTESPIGDRLLAFSAQGELRWMSETGTKSANSQPRLSPSGDVIFVKNMAFSTQNGANLNLHPPTEADPVLKNRAQYFVGADGELYLNAGHSIIQWDLASSGFEVTQSAEWDYRSVGLNQYSSLPVDAGATADSNLWFFYSAQYGETQVVWTDTTGKLAGISSTTMRDNSLLISIDAKNTAYLCGLTGGELTEIHPLVCAAYGIGMEAPAWEITLLERGAEVIGGALAPGRIYVATKNGDLFAIGGSTTGTPLPSATEAAGNPPETPSSGAPSQPIHAWKYKAKEPFGGRLGLLEDGRLYFYTETTLTILTLDGKLDKEISLKTPPFMQSEGRFMIEPVILPDGTVLVFSQENTVYALNESGDLLWEVTLEGVPSAPLVTDGRNTYLVDSKANLYAFNSQGVVWQFKPEGATKTTAWLIMGSDGTLYYAVTINGKPHVQAVSSEGKAVWVTQAKASFLANDLKVNQTGNYVFLKQDVFDARDGTLLDLKPPYKVDEYIGGQDGQNYLRVGHVVMQWVSADEGMKILRTASWNYQSRGTRYPSRTVVSSNQVIWMFYPTNILWMDLEGKILGTFDNPRAGFTPDFIATRLTFCSPNAEDKTLECKTYGIGSNQPVWEGIIPDIPDFDWGFMVDKTYYAVSHGSTIYKIDLP